MNGLKSGKRQMRFYPFIQAIISAVLFGVSAPAAKVLLGEIEPVLLAAFLYLGSGLGLLLYRSLLQAGGRRNTAEAGIERADFSISFSAYSFNNFA